MDTRLSGAFKALSRSAARLNPVRGPVSAVGAQQRVDLCPPKDTSDPGNSACDLIRNAYSK